MGEGLRDQIESVYIGQRPLRPLCFSTLKWQRVLETCHHILRELCLTYKNNDNTVFKIWLMPLLLAEW